MDTRREELLQLQAPVELSLRFLEYRRLQQSISSTSRPANAIYRFFDSNISRLQNIVEAVRYNFIRRMQQLQHMLSAFTPFITTKKHKPKSSTKDALPLKPGLLSLPPELQLEILSYLPLSSHITLSAVHPFYCSLLQFPELREKRYFKATLPAVNALLMKYTICINLRYGQVVGMDIRTPVIKLPGELRRIHGKATRGGELVVKIDLNGISLLDDRWVRQDLGDYNEGDKKMGLSKIMVLTELLAPSLPKTRRWWWWSRKAETKEEDVQVNEYHTREYSIKEDVTDMSVKELLVLMARNAVRENKLDVYEDVKCSFKVCRLGGKDGQVGFVGDVTVGKGNNEREEEAGGGVKRQEGVQRINVIDEEEVVYDA